MKLMDVVTKTSPKTLLQNGESFVEGTPHRSKNNLKIPSPR